MLRSPTVTESCHCLVRFRKASIVKTMVENETLPSFVASDWQDGNDDFQLQTDDFDTCLTNRAQLLPGAEANSSSTDLLAEPMWSFSRYSTPHFLFFSRYSRPEV
jgi:hypothetical protein